MNYPYYTPAKERDKPEMPPKTDCFAYSYHGGGFGTAKCNALHELYCKHENCRFYKTKEQREKEEMLNSKRSRVKAW